MNKISAKIKTLPKSPGVYHFLDEKGGVLYVGKAKNILNRIKQYFLKEIGRGPAIEQMVRLASDIRFVETESEIEAVILEAELIKKLRPKYNVRLKDDKSFLVIRITRPRVVIPAKAGIQVKGMDPQVSPTSPSLSSGRRGNEPEDDMHCFPIVELVRFRNIDLKDKTAEYFGPYPAGELLKRSLKILRRIFPFRDCSKTKYGLAVKKGRPCIYGDIGICSAPCVGDLTLAEYNQNILYLKNFLRGRKKQVMASLEKEMKTLSKTHQFEQAALVRNKLHALNHLKDVAIGLRDDVFDRDKIIFKRIECYDISNIGEQFVVGSMVVFTDGKKEISEYRKFRIKPICHFDSSQSEGGEILSKDLSTKPALSVAEWARDDIKGDLISLKQVLERRFKNDWPLPNLIVIDGGEMQLRVAKEVLKNFELSIPAISISKGPERKKNDFHFSDEHIAKYFKDNIVLQNVCIAARDEAHRFAIEYYRKLHRKSVFEKI